MGKVVYRTAMAVVVALLVALGCGPQRPKESMTAGHAVIGASDAIFDLAWQVSRDFQIANRGAFVDIVRADNRSLVDSLLNGQAEEAFLDRRLTPAETLAFHRAQRKFHEYDIALYPVYLLVPKTNGVEAIDSASLRGVLTGQITNWKQLGGKDVPITTYVPRPGEGALTSVVTYFGGLDSMVATACSTNAQMASEAKADSGALLIYSKPYEGLPFRRLAFRRGGIDVPANPKTIAEEPRYPFRLDLTYITTRIKEDVAAGYLTYAMSNLGQRGIMNSGYRPAAVPVRVIQR